MTDQLADDTLEQHIQSDQPEDSMSNDNISVDSESGDEQYVDASDVNLELEENNDTVIHSPYNEDESNHSLPGQVLESLNEDEAEENDNNDAENHSSNEVEAQEEDKPDLSEEQHEEPTIPEVSQKSHEDEETNQPKEELKYEEDASPEEISKSKNIKSTLNFLKKSFEEFQESKEFKNLASPSMSLNQSLTDAIEDIDRMLKLPANAIASINSILIFEALRNCCRCRINTGKIMALDGLSKLFAFQLLDEESMVNPPDALSVNEPVNENSDITPPPKQKLMDAAVDTITDCFEGESTNENVELQIIRCLTSLILMEDTMNICHGQSLLKAIRTIYNIFIFSLNSSTQTVAQATLIQVVEKVFQRVRMFVDSDDKTIDEVEELVSSHSAASIVSNTSDNVVQDAPLNLSDMKNLNDEEEANIDSNNIPEEIITEEQLSIKDAFLVFRSMAKISVKNIEDTLDMRSHAVRSKLLSLHMLHSILRDQVSLF